jgi:FkbM family methyltransferase
MEGEGRSFHNFLQRQLELWKMRQRVRLTLSDRSADSIPKVKDAGRIRLVDGHRVQIMHNGVLVSYGGYHGHWMAKIIEGLRGHHEPVEELAFHHVVRRLPPDAVMLEVGCFWAYYSLWFKKDNPRRVSYLIEPDPAKIEVGKLNFRLNGVGGEFVSGFIDNGQSAGQLFNGRDGQETAIQPITIDGFMKERSIAKLDILHADIQGAELALIEGASEALSQGRVDYLFISTHDDLHEKILERLGKFEYTVLFEHSVSESSSADGLIVAAHPSAPVSREMLADDFRRAGVEAPTR